MCSHNIIEDYIDIDPDKSKQIFYCDKCFTCFQIEDIKIQVEQYILLDNSPRVSNEDTSIKQENRQ